MLTRLGNLRKRSIAGLLLVGTAALLAGCKPEPRTEGTSLPATNSAASSSLARETLDELEARLDATVWRDEVLAQKYERTFVKLGDAIRSATNKLAALAALDFDSILLPKPKGSSSNLGLNINQQQFEPSTHSLPVAAWRQTLANLSASGWRLSGAEWYHEKFIPPRGGTNAWSEFSFEIFGDRLAGRVRFILKGAFAVEWDGPGASGGELMRPKRLAVEELTVFEREGAPGFTRHAVVTPNAPEKYGQMVNMHPVVVTDIDADDDDDIIMTGVNQLFRNDGAANFTPMEFISESVFRGSMDAGVVADFNGDALPDFITVGKQGTFTNQLVLYPGNGSVPFLLEPVVAWKDEKIVAPSVMTAGDVDLDGDLDLWIGQYKPPYKGGRLPTPYYDSNEGYPAFLLLNDGRGMFTQATATRGLNAKRFRRTLAGSSADLDGDQDLDLVTINDYAGVDLYYNAGTGHFRDETARLYNRHLFGMGHCVADFDRDGVLDFLAIGMSVPTVRRLEFMKLGWDRYPDRTQKRVDMAYGNRAYTLRSGRWTQPSFSDELARTGWSWRTTAFDFDNDGAIDVYVANGQISGQSGEDYDSHIWTHGIYVGSSREDPNLLAYFDKPFRGINTGGTSSNGYQHNVLLRDCGTNHYVNAAFLMGVAHDSDCRVVVSADLNKDGRLDLVLTEGQWFGGPHTGRNRLLVHLNQLETRNNWIGVRLSSSQPGVFPIGAKVWAETATRVFAGQIITGDSYQSQHPNSIHFGLGQIDHVQRIRVRWPNGVVRILENPPLNRYHAFQP